MKGIWLIHEDTGVELSQAYRALLPTITPAMRADFDRLIEERRALRAASDGPPNLRIAGDTAEIDVAGVLTEQEDFWLWLFGYTNTAYADIRDALMRAGQNPAVKRVVLRVDSPGGNVDGLFETIDALRAVTKPMTAVAKMACSAAYDIVVQASRVEAAQAASCFGSVGVAVRYVVYDEVVDITSTNAPNKRPDVRTEEGKAVVRKQLDDIHDLFVGSIAEGRKTTKERVNAEFGRGGVFLAAEALSVGMIDAIATAGRSAGGSSANHNTNASAPTGDAQGVEPMDLKTLKASHHETYEQAAAEGAAAERKRVCAHLKMGQAFGAMDVALKAIQDGTSSLDESVQADYAVAGRKRDAQGARQEDAATVAGATANIADGSQPAAEKDVGDKIMELAAKQGI